MNELTLMEKFADPALFAELSKSELIQGSLITTMMGMGTTFVVLTLLWFIIAMVSKAINSTQNKVKPSAEVQPAAVSNTAVPSNQTTANVEVTNDSELVAVITAAIAAMEGNAINPGNLIIRKINRISGNSNAWSRAGASEVLDSRKF